MSSVSLTKLYDLLSLKVGKETAVSLTAFIEEKVKDEFDNKSQILATKEDIAQVRIEAASTKSELIKWMFLFWISQVAVTYGFILFYLKK